MKEFLLKTIKITLFLLFFILLFLLLIVGARYIMGWSWGVVGFLLLGMVGVAIGILFLRKLWLRRREQRFVHQVIAQDEAHLQGLAGKEQEAYRELQDRWKEAIETLRSSHLRKFGNPLYVLPWYLVIGESGAGKTTAIQSARLSSPFVEFSRTPGISGTRNCDWWFFEQAVILDTAGRYAIPIDEGRDKEEWQRFLNLLVKYRKKEPLNGLIVTVAADKMLATPSESLEEEGRNIRRRIDELMRVLGSKVPIYVLVTKCDLIHGMAQFSDQLPANSLDQAMGVLKKDLSLQVTSFLDPAFEIIGERLRNFRILLLPQISNKTLEPGVFLFPEEFDHLRRGLGIFMETAFRENPYQETPILRGLYFSSGRQEGTPYSHFLKDLGLIGEKEVLPGTDKGLFLHDFFAKILPKERGLLAPTQRAIEWRTLTRNLGLVSWMVVGIAVCGLLIFSFLNNMEIIQGVPSKFTQPLELSSDMQSNMERMREFRDAILKVEEKNQAWKMPRFGLDASRKVERSLKDKFCGEFRKGFLESHDLKMAGLFAKLPDSISDGDVAPYVDHLGKRIRLLKDRLAGKDFSNLQEKPQKEKFLPSYDLPMGGILVKMPPEVKERFISLYLYYQVWRSDRDMMEKEVAGLQNSLERLFSLKGGQLKWLVAYANEQGLPPVTLGDFWKGTPAKTEEPTISPAFTREGKKVIDDFLNEIKFSDPQTAARMKEGFENYYRKDCLHAWYQFAIQFPKGIERIHGQKEWQQMAEKMGTDQGPYFEFLSRMEKELMSIIGKGHFPHWLRQVYLLQVSKTPEAARQGVSTAAGTMAKVAEDVKKYLAMEKKAEVKEGEETLESALAVAKAYEEYRNALATLVPVSASQKQAFEQASRVFSDDPTTSKAPLYVAAGALSRMKVGMVGGKAKGDVLGMLLARPLKFYEIFMRLEAGCYLQSQWDSMVLSAVKEVQDLQATQLLLSPEGPVEKFLNGPASPFIVKSGERGYYSKKVLEESIPFDSSFFSFLQQRESGKALMMKNNYVLSIKGFPGEANPGARSLPERTLLQLQCGTHIQALEISSFPKPPQTFQWAPNSCGDVFFQIEFRDLVLKKKYSGPQAFPEFLRDFHGGMRTFSPGDFQMEKAALERMGIRHIRVRYEIGGDQLAVRKFNTLPKKPPERIVKCWDQ